MQYSIFRQLYNLLYSLLHSKSQRKVWLYSKIDLVEFGGSSLSQVPLRSNLGKVIYTCVLLLPNSSRTGIEPAWLRQHHADRHRGVLAPSSAVSDERCSKIDHWLAALWPYHWHAGQSSLAAFFWAHPVQGDWKCETGIIGTKLQRWKMRDQAVMGSLNTCGTWSVGLTSYL